MPRMDRPSWHTHPRAPRRVWPWLLLGLCGWFVLLALRVLAVRAGPGIYGGCESCVDAPVILSDLLPTALLLASVAAAGLLRPGAWRMLPMAVALGVIVLYLIDLGIYLIFGMRLRLTDLLRYGGETRSTWSVVAPLLAQPRGVAMVAGLLLALSGWAGLIWTVPRRAVLALGSIAAASALAAATFAAPLESVDAYTYRDVLRNNRPDGVDRAYSPAFRAALMAASPEPAARQCIQPASGPARSVILLVVEGLSAYHSRLLGGTQDSTPKLDAWSRRASYFPDFHANGFTTDGGLIALLTGHVPLPAIGRYASTHAYAGYEKVAVPDLLAQLAATGYGTQFFTTGDLGFLDKGQWLRGLGFGHVEGADSPFYENLPRGGFNAASDQALFARYLDWYDHERTQTLNFSALLTVSTHPPFTVPGTELRDEAGAFGWADAQIDQFISALRQRHYFDHGVLLVTGDHRAMTTPRPEQIAHLGAGAISRVPMVVIGPSGLPAGPHAGRWQQTDFIAGLLDLADRPSCTDAFRGRLLGAQAQPARYVLHVEGAERDQVRVWIAGDTQARELVLDGDDTRWIAPPPEPDARVVLDHVNRARARLAPVPGDFIGGLIGRRLDAAP